MATIKNTKKNAIPLTPENLSRICPEENPSILIKQQQGLFMLVAGSRNPDEWLWIQCLDEVQMSMILRSTRTIPAVKRLK